MRFSRPALGFCFAALLVVPAAQGETPAGPRPVVIELFTSQGCSDCPAADRVVGELAKRKDVIALSLPVTYWDMLGWKDTFATAANTQRQKSYAKAMNRSGIFTPQMIVDGAFDVVGNQHDRVMAAVASRAANLAAETPVHMTVGTSSGRLEIAIDPSHAKIKPMATIWVMRTLSQVSVNVQEGENKNRKLNYTNVVRDLQRAGEWNGDAMKIDLPLTAGKTAQDGVAVILQSHDYGPVLAASALQVPPVNLKPLPPH
jgi:hypothetical protein